MNKGYLAAVFAPFFIAASIIVTKMAGTVAHPLVIAGLGTLMSVPFLLLPRLVSKTPFDAPKILKELAIPFWKVVATRNVIGQILIIIGFTMTTAVKSVLLLRLEPLFVFAWSVMLLGEKPKPPKLMLLLALLVGSALVVAPQGASGGPNLGDALIALSLLFFSYSYFPTQEVVSKATPAGLNILSNLAGGIIVTIIAVLACDRQAFQVSTEAIQLIAGYSITFFVIAGSLYFYAFKALKPWVIASFLSLEVVFGLILAFVVLKESIAPLQLMGAAVVLAATIGIGRIGAAEEKAEGGKENAN